MTTQIGSGVLPGETANEENAKTSGIVTRQIAPEGGRKVKVAANIPDDHVIEDQINPNDDPIGHL